MSASADFAHAGRRRESLTLECQVRLIKHAEEQDPTAVLVPLDLFVDGFWQGVAAAGNPRPVGRLQAILADLRNAHGKWPSIHDADRLRAADIAQELSR